MDTLTPKEAHAAISQRGAGVIDVRTKAEFSEGRIANAVNLDVEDFNFEERVKSLDPNKEYVVYCHSGGRSARACSYLKSKGFKKASNMEGGISAWKKEGLPVEK